MNIWRGKAKPLDILKILAMDREETIKTFESYQNKSENKTMY